MVNCPCILFCKLNSVFNGNVCGNEVMRGVNDITLQYDVSLQQSKYSSYVPSQHFVCATSSINNAKSIIGDYEAAAQCYFIIKWSSICQRKHVALTRLPCSTVMVRVDARHVRFCLIGHADELSLIFWAARYHQKPNIVDIMLFIGLSISNDYAIVDPM